MQNDPRRSIVTWLNNDRIEHEIQRALPAHVPVAWFMRCAQTAILNQPALAEADKESLLRELVAIAQLGLVTDPQLGEAWLIVDRHRRVQRRIGYQGLRRLAMQSGEVTALNAQVVYQNDACEIELGDTPSVRHQVDVKNPSGRGNVIGCYAVARVKGTDTPIVEWMSWAQIEAHRNRYSDAYRHPDPSKRGPWGDELAQFEMGRKTVFRRLAKWLPKSPMLAEALAEEDRADMRDVMPEQRVLPAPEDPMDRVVSEQRGNGSEEPQEAPERATPLKRAQTPPETAAEPSAASTAPQPPARKPGRPKSPDRIARDIIAELSATDPEDVSGLLQHHAETVGGLPEHLRTEVVTAAQDRMAQADEDGDGELTTVTDEDEPPFDEPVDPAAEWLEAVRPQIAALPTRGHVKGYRQRYITGAEAHGPAMVAEVERLLAEREAALPG